MRTRRGFTLLEVMVAVAILGLGLTVILSAQAGLFAASTHIRNESQAINLARCKMGEIEEELLRTGYPEIDQKDDGPCCDDEQTGSMSCSWKIERVELPESSELSESNPAGDNASLNLDTPSSGSGMPKGTGAFGALLSAGQNDAGILAAAGGADGGVQALSSMMGEASGGVSGLAPLVMSIVYPSLKPMLEASIRKITLVVNWKEGSKQRDLTIVQYVTNPMRGGITATDAVGLDGADAGSPKGSSTSSRGGLAPNPFGFGRTK